MTYLHFIGNVLANRAVVIIEVKQEVARSTNLQRTQSNGLRLLDILDRHPLALGDDILHLIRVLMVPQKRQVPTIESGLNPIHYIIYSVLAQ